MGASSITGKGQGAFLNRSIKATQIANGSVTNKAFQFLSNATSNIQHQINVLSAGVQAISTKMDYVSGGITWTFDTEFDQTPIISTSIELKNLADSIYPLSIKITDLTTISVTIKAYKAELNETDIIFSECDSDDVVIHVRAGDWVV